MTAVEKFIEQLEKQGDAWENVSIGRIQISIKVEDYLELQRQAKEKERQDKIEFACAVYDKYNFGPQDIAFREECVQFKSE